MDYISLAKKGEVEKRGAAEAEWRLYLKQPAVARGIGNPESIDCCVECPNYPACLEDPYMGCGDPSICGDPCGITTYTQKGPYLQTEWGQWVGYNNQSPNYGCATHYGNCSTSNTNVPTGCVATAMAQIIKYWAHPTHQSYNYAIMPDDNDSWLYTSEVPRLMRDAGDAVGMRWGCNASSAYLSKVPKALKDSFAYRNGNHTNTYSSIYGLMVANLNSGIPVILGSCAQEIRHGFWPFYSYTYENCHAWICDGYLDTYNSCYSYRKFHINWGWGGLDDGYFYYNSWNPLHGSANYQYAQELAYNLTS